MLHVHGVYYENPDLYQKIHGIQGKVYHKKGKVRQFKVEQGKTIRDSSRASRTSSDLPQPKFKNTLVATIKDTKNLKRKMSQRLDEDENESLSSSSQVKSPCKKRIRVNSTQSKLARNEELQSPLISRRDPL